MGDDLSAREHRRADESIAVSPDGAQVYVTGYSITLGAVTIAYAAGTGRQLWASRYKHKAPA